MAFEIQTYNDWLVNAFELLQRVGAVVIVAYISMRVPLVRRSLSGAQTSWFYQLATACFFGFIAILGTHMGLIFNTSNESWDWGTRTYWPLAADEAIIGLRDLMVLTAGIFGGAWIGLGAGILAGSERYFLQGNVGDMSALATIILGLGAGLSRHFWPFWTISVKGVLTVSVLGTLVQKLILLLSPLFADVTVNKAATLVMWETTLPVLAANSLGCLLFLLVIKDLEYDQIQIREKSAQLRALHAQVEPHFLNNMLTALQALIVKDPDRALNFLSKLAQFFNHTRVSASANSIRLADEMAHLGLYLDFQALRFPDKFNLHLDVPESLLHCHVEPRILQTLVENIFVHARHGETGSIQIEIKGEDLGEAMKIHVIDTGCGMTQERAEKLGKQAVISRNGSGSALYQIRCSLDLVFNGKANIEIKSALGLGTTVILNIPKRIEAW